MRIIVIGAGEIGQTLVRMLMKKHDVILVESDEKLAKSAANAIDALVINGDATELSILTDAGIQEADALVATTSDDKTNLMVSEIAKSTGVKKIISQVNSMKNGELFIKLGITSTVGLVEMAVTRMQNAVLGCNNVHILHSAGEIQIVTIPVGKDSHAISQNTATLLPAQCCCIYRDGKYSIPDDKTIIKEGDVLTVGVVMKDLARLQKLLNVT